MGDRFGTNSAIYDLSRLMTFAVGIPAGNVFSAPIILDNPAITSGVALFSHTPQPFSVAVAAASELSTIDLSFTNSGAAGTLFNGIKIEHDYSTAGTTAGINIFGHYNSILLRVKSGGGTYTPGNPLIQIHDGATSATLMSITVDGEGRFNKTKISDNQIEEFATNGVASLDMNYNGYNGGTTQFRDFKIYNGKNTLLATFAGAYGNFLFGTSTDKNTGPVHMFIDSGCSIAQYSAGIMYLAANSWFDGANSKRLIATNETALLVISNLTPTIDFYFQTDAGNTVDSIITNTLYYTFGKASAQIGNSASPGLIYINSMIYGGMYADNISQSVTIAATDTYYEVGGSISGGNTNGVTFQNSKELKILYAGIYLITYSISVQCASANQEVESSIMVNSTSSTRLSAHAMVTSVNTPDVLTGTNPISLSVNDVVKFCLSNHTATNNLVVSHANMSIVRIGA